MKDKKYVIVDVNILNNILKYLGNKPYIEVASIIKELNSNIFTVSSEKGLMNEDTKEKKEKEKKEKT